MATHVKTHQENQAEIAAFTDHELACRNAPEAWFGNAIDDRRAIAMCDQCPVKKACFERAMRLEEGSTYRFGVWGGKTARERRNIAKKRGDDGQEPAPAAGTGIPERIDAPAVTAVATHLRSGVNIDAARIAQHLEPGELRFRCVKRLGVGESVRAKVTIDDALLVLHALEDRARQDRATA